MAPVSIESTDPNWASNTTLDVLSDFYVANRGNNTIVRMQQDGTVVAIRRATLANGPSLGSARLNGIAGSPDGTKIWVTVSGRLPGQHRSGAVLELPAF
jgi:DNA-binding beta-propeller fold protein YncE